MWNSVLLLTVLITSMICVLSITAECIISINKDLSDPQPLLLNIKNRKHAFLSPMSGTDKIVLKENVVLEIYCPGSDVAVNNVSIESDWTNAKCRNGKFEIVVKKQAGKNVFVPFNSITCSKQPKASARYTENSCLNKYKEFEIGFKHRNNFLTLITGCYDHKKLITIYTKSKIPKSIIGHQTAYPRPNWIQGSFYNISNPNNLFTRNSQRLVINNLLDLSDSSTKYISNSGDFYLSRGHLSPKADFLYGSQQRATFYLINSIPQWQILNYGKWKYLENNIRELASSRELDLDIYTGTHGILSLPHETTGKATKIYLYKVNNTRKIPVPKYIWKIVYDSKSKMGVAFVGLNNPYAEDLDEYRICESVCDKLSYLDLNLSVNDFRRGFVYCCDVNDLKEKVNVIPEILVDNLLI